MKAVVCTRYGPPEVLQLHEVAKPTPRHNEVLIRIHATVVTAGDCKVSLRGQPFFSRVVTGRFATGLRTPRTTIFGFELAGEIEAVGRDVTRYKKGDMIFGGTTLRLGAHAEYICLPEDGPIAIKPTNMAYEEAAAIVEGAMTALPCLRDLAKIQKGQQVLIIGASGSTGTAAVQLARYFGAEVTGVCSTVNLELVKSLGADRVIDYTQEDFTQNGQTYDVIFAIAGNSTFSRCRDSLKPEGVYLTDKPTLAVIPHILKLNRKRAILAYTGVRSASAKCKDLAFIRELIEAGKLKVVIDRCYPLEQIVEAYRYVEKGHKKGNVVITVAHDDREEAQA